MIDQGLDLRPPGGGKRLLGEILRSGELLDDGEQRRCLRLRYGRPCSTDKRGMWRGESHG